MDEKVYAKKYIELENNYTKTELIWYILDMLEQLGELDK